MPAGWFVESATVETDDEAAYPANVAVANVLYAPGGRFEGDGPALLVGKTATDDLMPLGDPTRKRVPGFGDAQDGALKRFGDFTVVQWSEMLDGFESPFVVAKGLSDTEVVEIARTASVEPVPSVPSDRLPAGWQRVASAPRLPRQGGQAAQRIAIVNGDGTARADVLAYRLDDEAATIDGFVAALQSASIYSVSAPRRIGSTHVVAIARADIPVVETLARAVASVTAEQWTAFQRTALQVPAAALCGDSLRETATIQAERDTVRVIIAVPTPNASTDAGCVARVIRGDEFLGAHEGHTTYTSDGKDGETGVTLSVSDYSDSERDSWAAIGGTVPLGTTRVVVEAPGVRSVEARIVDFGADRTRRYYGAYVDPLGPQFFSPTVIAYGPDGELARFTSGWTGG